MLSLVSPREQECFCLFAVDGGKKVNWFVAIISVLSRKINIEWKRNIIDAIAIEKCACGRQEIPNKKTMIINKRPKKEPCSFKNLIGSLLMCC